MKLDLPFINRMVTLQHILEGKEEKEKIFQMWSASRFDFVQKFYVLTGLWASLAS